jgi:hypothetical protein
MLALAFLKWWYGAGWKDGYAHLRIHLKRTYYGLSVPQLLPTLFSPWRRILSPGGGAIGDRLRAFIDNALSRIIGSIVRTGTLITAGVIMAGWILVAVIRTILWPCIPLAGVILIVGGVFL